MNDKKMHFAAGFVLAFIGGFVPSAIFGAAPLITLLFMFILPIIGAVGKEVVDSMDKNNRFDIKDVWATLLGAAVLWIPGVIIYLTN